MSQYLCFLRNNIYHTKLSLLISTSIVKQYRRHTHTRAKRGNPCRPRACPTVRCVGGVAADRTTHHGPRPPHIGRTAYIGIDTKRVGWWDLFKPKLGMTGDNIFLENLHVSYICNRKAACIIYTTARQRRKVKNIFYRGGSMYYIYNSMYYMR
jgi:hypothetical protein